MNWNVNYVLANVIGVFNRVNKMRLIDADELLKKSYCAYIIDNYYLKKRVVDFSDINVAPTVEAEPVRHGHWISVGMGFDWHYECSQCGYVDGYAFNDRHKYCPNCGAKMDAMDDWAKNETD